MELNPDIEYALPMPEIEELRHLYPDHMPERIALERMLKLEEEHAKLVDENDFLQAELEVNEVAVGARDKLVEAAKTIADLKEAVAELARDPRTRDQIELVWRLKVKGILK